MPNEKERGELTLEQLREWLAKRRVSMLAMESATSDHAQAKMYRTKAHELLTIINAIDKDELPT